MTEYFVGYFDVLKVFRCGRILGRLRHAAVMGCTLGTDLGPGLTPIPQFSSEVCVMGYDLECEGADKCRSLPLPSDKVTCASAVCSCGYETSYRSQGIDSSERSILCRSSKEVCERLHDNILEQEQMKPPKWEGDMS